MRSLDSLLELGSKVVSILFMPELNSSDAKHTGQRASL
ncbi:hypothetical protein PMI32_04179 [Pseudomonas sp. GM60]|nr:hypothetical protein PMI32_04179 [Pseudomonas sp. GM60]